MWKNLTYDDVREQNTYDSDYPHEILPGKERLFQNESEFPGYSADFEKALQIILNYGYTALVQNYVCERKREAQITILPLYVDAAVRA